MSVLELFFKGEEKLRAEHERAEAAKVGILRGGSAGCLLDDGTTIGCPHEALARYLGYSLNKSLSQGYFDGGSDNEVIWERNISAALPTAQYSAYRCEEDVPVRYELDNKYLITGRPDLVIGDMTHDGVFVPARGLELKGCYSLDTSSDRLYGMKPDAKHLCQAGFYMMAMDIPWSLIYTINVTGDMSFFKKRDYGEAKLPLGKVEFMLGFNESGHLCYIHPETKEVVQTVITQRGILDYYRLIADMAETKQVGMTRMASITATGEDSPFDYNLYNSFALMVPLDQGWDKFIEYCERLKDTTRFIRYSKGKYITCDSPEAAGPRYIAQPVIIGKYNTLSMAREVAYEPRA